MLRLLRALRLWVAPSESPVWADDRRPLLDRLVVFIGWRGRF